MADTARTATLHLVATPIGNLQDMTDRGSQLLRGIEVVACEDTRRTGRLLQHLNARPRRLLVANEHTEARAAEQVVGELNSGVDVALVSDAGLPGVSDPGERIVRAVIDAGHRVTVLPGASAPVAALVISGLACDRYVMEGFLPRKGRERGERLADIADERRTVVLLESPKRLGATLIELAGICGPDRPVVVVRELTKLHEEVVRGPLDEVARRYAEPPKGEIVIVLGGAALTTFSDEAIVAALLAESSAGQTTRDAVDAVVARLGVARNRVYGLATAR